MDDRIKRLAREFAQELCETLDAEEMALVRERNATAAYAGCCASHDFCDANMLMLAAYARANGIDEDAVDVSDDAVIDVMNRAWDVARASGFDALKIEGGV